MIIVSYCLWLFPLFCPLTISFQGWNWKKRWFIKTHKRFLWQYPILVCKEGDQLHDGEDEEESDDGVEEYDGVNIGFGLLFSGTYCLGQQFLSLPDFFNWTQMDEKIKFKFDSRIQCSFLPKYNIGQSMRALNTKLTAVVESISVSSLSLLCLCSPTVPPSVSQALQGWGRLMFCSAWENISTARLLVENATVVRCWSIQ